ncbi:hypothetical protein R3P38DRAFT_3199482 [Favolaschia claudopus]|uniref:Uncharacterized protein n=1 Tax=Favolaschia claudopus TaxID=2862362 RepID=A0AAW0B394_9AGAR
MSSASALDSRIRINFETLSPIQTLFIPAKKGLLMNDSGDKRPRPVDFDRVKTWGLEEFGLRDVLFVRASSKYCLRMIFNAERSLHNPDPATAYDRLMKDAMFHSDHLEGVQGLPVPKHYGMWIMNTGGWAGIVLFSPHAVLRDSLE